MKKIHTSTLAGIFLALPLLVTEAWAATAHLSWSPNTEPDLAGYVAHYGTSPGTYTQSLDVGNATGTDFTNLVEGQTYYFAVTAYDATGNKSGLSSEVSLTVPGTPPPDPGPDTTPPGITSVATIDATTLEITFSESVDPTTAETASRYLIDGVTPAVTAILLADGVTVRLTTFAQVEGDFHTVAVNGVLDLAGNAASTEASYTVVFDLSIQVITPLTYDPARINVGDRYYVDRQYTVSDLPPEYQGSWWVRTANDDKSQTVSDWLRFSVDRDAIVYVGYDQRAGSPPDWLTAAFVPTGTGPASNDAATPFVMYARDVPAGEVVLGGNLASGASGARANYAVLVQSLSDIPAARDGDGDGMDDTWEASMGLNTGVADAHDDADGDGLTNLQEFWLKSDPLDAGSGIGSGSSQAPVIQVNDRLTGVPGQTFAFDAGRSYDPDGDPLSWGWVQVMGPAVNVQNSTTSRMTFTPASGGDYAFRLTVRDNAGGISSSTVYAKVGGTASTGGTGAAGGGGCSTTSGSGTGPGNAGALLFLILVSLLRLLPRGLVWERAAAEKERRDGGHR